MQEKGNVGSEYPREEWGNWEEKRIIECMFKDGIYEEHQRDVERYACKSRKIIFKLFGYW